MSVKMDSILGVLREQDEIGTVLPEASPTIKGITKRGDAVFNAPESDDVAATELGVKNYVAGQNFLTADMLAGYHFNISNFNNDTGYVTISEVSNSGFLTGNDLYRYDVGSFRNDIGYLTGGDLNGFDLSVFQNNTGFITVSYLQQIGVSIFNNDAGYTTFQDISNYGFLTGSNLGNYDLSAFQNNTGFLTFNDLNGWDISQFSNDAQYVTLTDVSANLSYFVEGAIIVNGSGRLDVRDATEAEKGTVQFASDVEAADGNVTDKAVTPKQLAIECAKRVPASVVVSGGTVSTSYAADGAHGNIHDITLSNGYECILTTGNILLGKSLLLRVNNAAGGSLSYEGTNLLTETDTGVYLVSFVNISGSVECFGKAERIV